MTLACRLTVLLLFTAASASAQQPPDFAAFDRYVDKAARDWNAVGLGIAVVKNDSLVFAKGYGVIELGKSARVNEHTRFAIGSTTKAMTSAALAMLVDAGKLRWDDKVIDYIPELRLYDAYVTRELTIRDLLTHRSGLPSTDLFWGIEETVLPFPEMIRRLRYVRPSSSFRSTWAYHNVMYSLGGTVIERASGMTWAAFIRSRIFTPLGMSETEALTADIIGKPNVAVPHATVKDTVRAVPVRLIDVVAPAGSVWSSVADMSKWMRFVLDSGRVGTKRLITPANFRELVAPQIRAPLELYSALELAAPHFLSYGLGWFVQDYRGKAVWMHTGSIDGMSAIIGLLPEQRVGVFVLGNLDHIELRHALMYQVFDLYSAGPARDWSSDLKALLASKRAARPAPPSAARVAVAKPSLAVEKYAGTYVDSAYGVVVVAAKNGTLTGRYDTLELGVLTHSDFDTFRSTPVKSLDGATPLVFQLDGAGGVASVRMLGVTFVRTRTP